MACEMGKILLIINPAAQNGASVEAAAVAMGHIAEDIGDECLFVETTNGPRHAIDIAAAAGDYDTVIALGGDGIIHETVNGLMQIEEARRPALGVIPVGSGNDYARTLGMARSVEKATAQLLAAKPVPVDLGRCNGTYFTETVSFGLDAAIAIDTMERRRRTGRTGTLLYMGAGFDQLANHRVQRRYQVSFDGEPAVEGEMYLFAVQNGPFYGGGFKIAPDASIIDGALNVAIAHGPLSFLKALAIFLSAKNGYHTKNQIFEFRKVRSLAITFDEAPPCQIDGEEVVATTFGISVAHQALRVLIPPKSPALA